MPKRKPLALPKEAPGEVWKQFHPNYYISNRGRVYSLVKKMVIIPQKNNWGYYRFRIFNENKKSWVLAHALVVKVFGDINGNKIPEGGVNRRKINIDHIDYNKANNKQSNLEVVTARENTLRKIAVLRQRKQVNRSCTNTARIRI